MDSRKSRVSVSVFVCSYRCILVINLMNKYRWKHSKKKTNYCRLASVEKHTHTHAVAHIKAD